MHNWWITEYEWLPTYNAVHPLLVDNLAWLRTHGAHVVEESVDGFNAATFVEQRAQLHRNHVSTVVWGSPWTDTSTHEGYSPVPRSLLTAAENERMQQEGAANHSALVKGAVFRHLQDMFPYATVVITCGRCNPAPSVSVLGHASAVLSVPAHIPTVGEVRYRPSFASGQARIEEDEQVRALVAVPESLRPHLRHLFCPQTGDLDLYSLIAISAEVNMEKGSRGLNLFIGEGSADLSRSAGEVAVARRHSGLFSTCQLSHIPSSQLEPPANPQMQPPEG